MYALASDDVCGSCAVVDDSKEVETAVAGAGSERSETDKLVDGMDFGELCNDFECISSPYVESTARQIARDILEIREDNRALACYAVAVKYKVRAAPYQLISPDPQSRDCVNSCLPISL
jgi:hypothetical protein